MTILKLMIKDVGVGVWTATISMGTDSNEGVDSIYVKVIPLTQDNIYIRSWDSSVMVQELEGLDWTPGRKIFFTAIQCPILLFIIH
jgi:hypothetical protein